MQLFLWLHRCFAKKLAKFYVPGLCMNAELHLIFHF